MSKTGSLWANWIYYSYCMFLSPGAHKNGGKSSQRRVVFRLVNMAMSVTNILHDVPCLKSLLGVLVAFSILSVTALGLILSKATGNSRPKLKPPYQSPVTESHVPCHVSARFIRTAHYRDIFHKPKRLPSCRPTYHNLPI